ncbi:MAG: hypothetical protein LAO06_01865 [Acidobacteriia bacterium]|nr:hypothetical protein [Terriglobia bacterium]
MSFCPRFPLQLAGLVLLSSALFAQSQSIPLGDVVRAPKPEKKAAKVYTNDEIPSRPSEPPASPPAVKDSPASDNSTASSQPGKPPATDSTLKGLKADEAKLIQDRDKLRQELESETEDLRKLALSERLDLVNADLQDVQQLIAQRSKAGAASKPSDASEPGPPAPAVAPK